MHVFLLYFAIPNGAVWSNILAEPIIAALTMGCLWLFRDRIGKHWAAWHHKHTQAHLATLALAGSVEGPRADLSPSPSNPSA